MRNSTTAVGRLALGIATFGGFAALGVIGSGTASASEPGGVVYTATNAATGNSVESFVRQADGSLAAAGSYPTGGLGTGAAVGSQGSVTLSPDGRTLLVVDAGSSQVSDFAVHPGGSLSLLDVVGSGGADPVSVAIRDGLVEVLNAGSPNVAGFTATRRGLMPIVGGSQPLSAGASGAVDVTIAPNRTAVVVTEKTSDTIDTFALGAHGSLAPAVTNPSNGPGAFASAYSRGQLLVADAGGAGTSAVSDYRFTSHGTLVATQPALPNSQSAACWIVAGTDGDIFVANAGSSTISTYRVLSGGTLAFFGNTTLPVGTLAGKPLDEAVARDGASFYVVDEANSQIDAFTVGSSGQLTPAGQPQPIAAGSAGLAAS